MSKQPPIEDTPDLVIGLRLDVSTLTFLLNNRTKERDQAREIAVSLEQELAEVRKWLEAALRLRMHGPQSTREWRGFDIGAEKVLRQGEGDEA